jgi:hypothetical protein
MREYNISNPVLGPMKENLLSDPLLRLTKRYILYLGLGKYNISHSILGQLRRLNLCMVDEK